MNRTVLILIVVIVIVAGAAGAFLLLNGTGGVTGTQAPKGQESPVVTVATDEPTATSTPATVVVMAVQEIPRGVPITPDMVQEVVFPAQFAPEGAFTNKNDVVGLIAATTIVREEIILSRKLVQDFNSLGKVGSAAAAILDPNRVAIAVPIDKLRSVAYALQPGDYVDIIVSMLFVDVDTDFQTILPNKSRLISAIPNQDTGAIQLVVGDAYAGSLDTSTLIVPSVTSSLSANFSILVEPSERQRPRLLTVRTVSNAQVIYLGEFPSDGDIFRPASAPTPTPAETAAPSTGSNGQAEAAPTSTPIPPRPDVVTIAVLPQDAVILTYMIEANIPMTFVLRSARAQGLPNTDPVTLSYIMGRFGVQPPDRFSYSIEPAIRSVRGITLEGSTDTTGTSTTSTSSGQ